MLLRGSIWHISSALRKHRIASPWCLKGLAVTSVGVVTTHCERQRSPSVGGMDLMDGFVANNFVYVASVGLMGWTALLLLKSIMRALNTDCLESPSGLTFEDPDSPSRIPVPSIHVDPAKTITVVFPAFNEGNRLKAAVDEAIEHLNLKRKHDSRFSYEIIVVDDGSSDDTYAKAMKFVQRYGLDTVRVLRLPVNKGKGAAVRAGILAGRGETLLFADSDGATQFSEVDKLYARLETLTRPVKPGKENTVPCLFQTVAERHGMVIGSRAHLESTDAVAKRHWCRNLLMHGFHFLVLLVAGPGVKDTQCGFKLFTRKTAKVLFQNMRLQRWCFDVELIYLANRLRVPIGEENIAWTEVAGSKIRAWSILSMAFELFLIKAAYSAGAWTILGEHSAVDS